MMRMIAFIVVIAATSACQSNELRTVEDLNRFVSDSDNGLQKSADANGYKMEVVYKPTDLWVAREIGYGVVDEEKVRIVKNKYDAYHYFVLNISNDSREALNSVDPNEFGDLVTTLSFRMSESVTLTTSSNDTIPVSDFVFDRTYGRSNANSLLFVFEKQKSVDDEWVQLNLDEFGMRTGNQHFRFRTRDLIEIPRLSFVEQKN